MNHLGDANKISDTPRTDAAYFKAGATMYDLAGEMKRIERELNAANDRIKQLEEMYEGVIGERPEFLVSNVMGLLKRELNFSQKRIKRLEEAGDFLSHYLRQMPYASDYLSQVDERILRISNWRRAKEDNL